MPASHLVSPLLQLPFSGCTYGRAQTSGRNGCADAANLRRALVFRRITFRLLSKAPTTRPNNRDKDVRFSEEERMKTRILIAAGLGLAFVMGTVASGLYNRTSETVSSAPAVTTTRVAAAPAAVRTRYAAPAAAPAVVRVADSTAPVAEPAPRKRSWQKEALIIGGSAGAGAAIGAVAGGKKGAAIGAVSGGVAGLVYDLATRNK
jgi:hypothetical protein